MKKVIATILTLVLLLSMTVQVFAVDSIQLTVKMRSGETLQIADLESDNSIDTIKQKIQDKEGIAPDQQRLLFNGVQLEDGRTLSDYGIKNSDVIYLLSPVNELTNNPSTNEGEGSYSIGVTGTYVAGATADPTISVDIAWDKMDFTYTDGGSTYNTQTHKTTTTDGSWSTGKKPITVTNHSNVGITADFTFTQGDGVTTTGSFYDSADATTVLAADKQNITLISAEDKTTEGETYTVPSGKIYFGVSGDAITENKSLGTITVKISKDTVKWTIVTTQDALSTALNAGGNVRLGGNIELSGTLTMDNSVTTVLDLNGYKLSHNWDNTNMPQFSLRINNSANLTVKDSSSAKTGEILLTGSGNNEIFIDGATFNLESGTISSKGGSNKYLLNCSYVTTVNISGGTIQSEGDGICFTDIDTRNKLNITGGTISAENAAIITNTATTVITGGTFSDDPSAYVDTANYTVTTNNDGTYTVTKKQ